MYNFRKTFHYLKLNVVQARLCLDSFSSGKAREFIDSISIKNIITNINNILSRVYLITLAWNPQSLSLEIKRELPWHVNSIVQNVCVLKHCQTFNLVTLSLSMYRVITKTRTSSRNRFFSIDSINETSSYEMIRNLSIRFRARHRF